MLKTRQQEKLYSPTDVNALLQCHPQVVSVKFENLVHTNFKKENSYFGVLHWQQWQFPVSAPALEIEDKIRITLVIN